VPGEEAPRFPGSSTLTQDAEPSLFIYRQVFVESGKEFVREGIMGLLNRSEAQIFPHEDVEAGRVAACMQAIEKGQCDPGSIWLWCDDARNVFSPLLKLAGPPEMEAADLFGCTHQMVCITDPFRIWELQRALDGRPLFIADGHHRFAAGWNLATIQIRTSMLRSRGGFSLDQIEQDARRGVLLAPKSTDFYPKLAAGLAIHRNQNENVMPPVAHRPGVRKPSSK
jgi:uncharacterized protein (DUF1015 family)